MTLSEAIARSLRSLDARVATHVPGHGASQTFAAFRDCPPPTPPQRGGENDCVISFHEEAAYAVAHGAALAGVRSACIIKSHGLTKAMNAVMDSLSCGVTAGMVNFVFEDKGGSHSDNIIEILPVIEGAEMPHKVSTVASIVEDIAMAYRESERLQLPYTLVLDSEFIGDDVGAAVGAHHAMQATSYKRDVMRHVVCPIFAGYQRDVLVAKLRGEDFDAVPRPAMPVLPQSLPPAYQKAVAPYQPLFEAFKSLDVDFVCGDAGVSTLSAFPPYEIVHAALYMGGSVPTIVGAHLAGMKRSWAFIGDFSFISAGHYGLIEALLRKTPIKVLIYANGRAETTGGQSLDLEILERLLKGYEQYVRRIDDPFDREKMLPVLREANEAEELRIVVARYA
jgi:TPP-dependent indolepyruvate ferredoxin oxidoreductase alpha subunit